MTINEEERPLTTAHKAYLALAGTAFGLHAILLATIPTAMQDLNADPFFVNVAVSLYAGIGLLSDLPAGRFAQRVGGRKAVLVGLWGSIIGCAALYLSSNLWAALALSAAIGLSFSFILTPVLVGVAITARVDGQVRSQGVNAALQRLGALVATLFLLRLGSPSGLDLAYSGIAIICAAMLVLCWQIPSLATEAPSKKGPRGSARHVWSSSPMFRAGICVNLTTLVLLVYVGSLILPVFELVDETHAFGVSLMAREMVCVLTAGVLFMRPSMGLVRRLWFIGAVGCGLGFACVPLVAGLHWLLAVCILGFGGIALGSGIVLANTLLHYGLEPHVKYVGFALSSVFNKALAIIFPLVLGILGDYQMPFGGATAGVIIIVFVIMAGRFMPYGSGLPEQAAPESVP